MKSSLLTATLALTLATGVAAADTPRPPRVLIIPFNTLNLPSLPTPATSPANPPSPSKTLQQNLVVSLGRDADLTPVPFEGNTLVEDNATAARLARAANAPLALRGTAQAEGTGIRITAQLLDAKTGNILRVASATGPATDILKLENDIADQLRTAAEPPVIPPPLPSAAPPVTVQSPPQIVYVPTPTYYPAYYAPSYNPWGYNGYFPYGNYPIIPAPSVTITHTHQGPHGSNLPIPTGSDFWPIPNTNQSPTPTINMSPTPTRPVNPLPTSGR